MFSKLRFVMASAACSDSAEWAQAILQNTHGPVQTADGATAHPVWESDAGSVWVIDRESSPALIIDISRHEEPLEVATINITPEAVDYMIEIDLQPAMIRCLLAERQLHHTELTEGTNVLFRHAHQLHRVDPSNEEAQNEYATAVQIVSELLRSVIDRYGDPALSSKLRAFA